MKLVVRHPVVEIVQVQLKDIVDIELAAHHDMVESQIPKELTFQWKCYQKIVATTNVDERRLSGSATTLADFIWN
ncbi:hypothetical protein CHUAL_013922 [Chamberlinius hualienensis]